MGAGQAKQEKIQIPLWAMQRAAKSKVQQPEEEVVYEEHN